MEKQGCLNVTLDDQNYSSPMPIIGLYIVAGTLVCVLFMVCDVFHGLYRRKPWIPCKLFSLNSLTLSLLAIASKLPTDLTTPMPSVHDQLSKLSGTVLICVSMCVFFPSLGSQSDSERLSNMLSLSIFVVTVVVNVCMQMVTGVIFLFMVEHVIIMSLMLLLLTVLWFASDFGNCMSISSSSNPVDELIKSDPQNSENKSMIHILKSFYKSSSKQSPELVFFVSPMSLTICMLSTLVLLQAALRSFVLKKVDFRCGVSNYKWSMRMVVVTQILTVLVGSIVTIFRGLLVLKEFDVSVGRKTYVLDFLPALSKFDSFSTWVLSTLSKLRIISFFKIFRKGFMILFQTIESNVLMVLFLVHVIITILAYLFYQMLKIPFILANQIIKICFGEKRNDEGRAPMDIAEWIERNCEVDIDRWMEKYKRTSPIENLIQVLSKTSKSEEPFTNKVSCLSVVIFVRIAIVALPSSLNATLIRTLEEAFEIIYFIQKKEISTSEEKNCLVVAKNLWINKNNTCHWFHRKFIKPSVKKIYSHLSKESNDGSFECQPQPQLDLRCALGFIEQIKERCDGTSFFTYEEGYYAVSEIQNVCGLIIEQRPQQTYSSIDGLFKHMEQLFVDMLHFFLSQLPLSIFKHLVESTAKQREERARLVLKFLCKLEPLEYKVHWSFPDRTGITSLINTQVPVIDTQSTEQVGGNVDDADVVQHVAHRAIDSDEIEELV